jgi:hypothetical protein
MSHASQPRLEQFPLRGFAAAVGSFECHQKSTLLFLDVQQVAKSCCGAVVRNVDGHQSAI